MPINVKMDDHVFRELEEKLGRAKHAFVKVGVLEAQGSATANDGETTIAEIAAIHEFGAPRANIPARSFLRNTFTQEPGREALSKTLTALARSVIAERLEVREALEKLGAWAVSQVKRRIKGHIPPPLKAATIKAKGSSTPLVDTGQLINSIMHEVKE